MIYSCFKKVVLVSTAIVWSFSACAQQADFNEVGKQMAIMLQNSHFAKLSFNAELSQRFLDEYLKDLDYQRLYFTQKDIDDFNLNYGNKLHTLLLNGNSMSVAMDIYRVYEERVHTRVLSAEKILKEERFDFSVDEFVTPSRKNAAWPVNEIFASELWRLQIKEAVLSEILRRELIAKLAKEQGKPDPGILDRSPTDKILLRYKRFASSVKDVDEEDIANYFLSAVARAYDPHTDYMSFREMNRFKDGMKNELVGIGALLQGEEDGSTKIKGIVVGGPADREGTLTLNDRVVAVDALNTGKAEDMIDIMFMKIDKVVDYIRGKEDSMVALKVEPAGGTPGETKIVVIRRGKVEMKDEQARAQLIEMKSEKGVVLRLGLLTLPSFYADFDEGKVRCSVDVEKILKRLVEERIDGLILDLRNNGGGSLEEVRRMVGFFIESGPVVQVKNTLGQVQVRDSDRGKPIYSGSMVVMTDKSSASASEILAGALQDLNRAVIVGDSSTFGKGTVQQPMDIGRMLPLFAARNRAGFLKVTIQKFYRPSGSSTQMDGVKADVVMPSFFDAMEMGEFYLDHSLPHDRIRPAGDFKALDPQKLFIPQLKILSAERVSASKDFSYIIEDGIKAKNRFKANRLSLNKSIRENEITQSENLQKSRNAEKRVRFEQMSILDREFLRFYKLSLEDVEAVNDLKLYNPSDDTSDYMRRAKDDSDTLDQTPKWPTGLDPVKREALKVLADLVELTEDARVNGLLKGTAEIQ